MDQPVTKPVRFRWDAVQLLLSAMMLAGLLLPFVTLRANRIVPGKPLSILEGSDPYALGVLLLVASAVLLAAVLGASPAWRIAFGGIALAVLLVALGTTTTHTPVNNPYARMSPAAGFWLVFSALALLLTDALARLAPKPAFKLLFLALSLVLAGVLLSSGALSGLSIMKEYGARADVFWREAFNHVLLALGSLAAAAMVGIPLGLACHRLPKLGAPLLAGLNVVQTIPSIALFGMLIGPLAWLGTHSSIAAALGIRGIGAAPAFVALFLYSLLPMVANTVSGLAAVPDELIDTGRAMGMTDRQRLWRVEFPLALPVMLTAVRIVLVQNIGLATVAALIGGGGFGTFVFQGLGQNAADLVLLGAIPTVVMAFVAAVLMDSIIGLADPRRGNGGTT